MKRNFFLKTAFILSFLTASWLLPAESIEPLPKIGSPVKEEKAVEKTLPHPLFAKDSFAGLVGGWHFDGSSPEMENALGQAIFQADSRPARIFVGLQVQYKQVYLTTQLHLRPFTFDNVRLDFLAMGNVDFYDLSRIDTCQLAGFSLEIRSNDTVFMETSCLFLLNFQTLGEIIDKNDYLHPEHCICADISLRLNFPKTTLAFTASTYETFLYRAYEHQSYKLEFTFTPVEHLQITATATARMQDLFILKPKYQETEATLGIRYLF